MSLTEVSRRRLEDIVEHHRGRVLYTKIPASSIINFMVTEITSPDSLKPVSGTIGYFVKDPNGYMIE